MWPSLKVLYKNIQNHFCQFKWIGFCWMALWTVEQRVRGYDQPYPLITQDWSYCSSHLPKTETVVSLPFLLSFLSSHPSFFEKKISFSPLLPLLLPRVNNCHTFSLSPPAGVWLVKSGGCWRSSQSCKWGSPPGWPRHTVVQVRKPAMLPTKQRWERRGLCVLT